jgi:ABC-type Fe3+-hydroxamate transport system substrate-binding protein
VVSRGQAAFAPLSLEFIARSDPDVIIELDPDGRQRPHGDADALRVWAKVGPLRAVGAGRVHVLTGSQHYVLGPRIALTYHALCRAIAGKDHD